MLNDIVNAISVKLNNVFGDSYEIYTENVKQGIQEPCFFIQSLPTSVTPLLGKRSKRTYTFVISYFPRNGNEEMMMVSDELLSELEYIELKDGDILRGSEMSTEIVDDILHFNINYNVIVYAEETINTMSSVVRKVGTKGV